ncbi:mitotic spindle checkpoint protein [Grosmannia clavigera kw1407]|uniref:Mitotic spindle checkpoint protein n=1 Tax=Grosmannia clavigera (strain kw1407 / UAMH 11150) TaxID=655863 RepID=F0X8H2_GROCL|nr:mitotic spindle checkpoint protein [Grosmannia clavigera kw1407]EFX05840.1 mitotic spindle checkpoint protein [Grosmannia clavigera kw1407]
MASVPLGDAAALFAALGDFFHVAVHSVLYYRQLYPERSFLSATAFGVPVHQSRHPQVCAWVTDAVDHAIGQLAGGAVETVAVVVHAPFGGAHSHPNLPPGAVLERWVFDVSHVPAWPGGADALQQALHPNATKSIKSSKKGRSPQKRPLSARKFRPPRDSTLLPDEDTTPWDRTDDEDGYSDDNNNNDNNDDDDAESEADLDTRNTPQSRPSASATSADLHQQLRAAILRLTQTAASKEPLPPRCTFTVVLEIGDAAELRQPGRPATKRSTAWIPEETAGTKRKWAAASSSTTTNTTTTTIRTVDAAPLFMECWVEQSVLTNNNGSEKTSPGLHLPVIPPPHIKGPIGKTVAFDT